MRRRPPCWERDGAGGVVGVDRQDHQAIKWGPVVQDEGRGRHGLDPLTGYRLPHPAGPFGLWNARRRVSELIIDPEPGPGCRVLLIQS